MNEWALSKDVDEIKNKTLGLNETLNVSARNWKKSAILSAKRLWSDTEILIHFTNLAHTTQAQNHILNDDIADSKEVWGDCAEAGVAFDHTFSCLAFSRWRKILTKVDLVFAEKW